MEGVTIVAQDYVMYKVPLTTRTEHGQCAYSYSHDRCQSVKKSVCQFDQEPTTMHVDALPRNVKLAYIVRPSVVEWSPQGSPKLLIR